MKRPPERVPPRVHLLPARRAPRIVALVRARAKRFHVIAIDARRGRVERGSWFAGKLYPGRCDVSPDGRLMTYLAMGADGSTWNGVCEPPWLKTTIDRENMGTWFGGGWFADDRTLMGNLWDEPKPVRVAGRPLRVVAWTPTMGNGEDLGVLYQRLVRDGFTRCGDEWGTDRRRADATRLMIDTTGDDGWARRPAKSLPSLRLRFVGYLTHGYTFAVELEGEHAIDLAGVHWACWDCDDRLWLARRGLIERYDAAAIRSGRPTLTIDTAAYEPPTRLGKTP